MHKLTILTPAYNRAAYLPKLYESLRAQTNRDFLWLVVDDGSEDGTKALIASYMDGMPGSEADEKAENRGNEMRTADGEEDADTAFDIQYIEQKNMGKHTALNRGIREIATELTFIVDSDDYLPKTAVETILRYHEKYKDTPGLCGYSFLRCHGDGRVNTAYFPADELIGTYAEVRINGGIGGDKAEVFYTSILKQYPFPTFPGEKFLPEDVVWMRMSGPYRMVHINENVYYCDYLEDGLTNTGKRMKIHSPRGMVLRAKIYLDDPVIRAKVKLKMMLLYQIYGRFARISGKELKQETGEKALWYLCRIPAFFFYLAWKLAF